MSTPATAPIERELKLDVPLGFHMPDVMALPGLSLVMQPEKTLTAVYYDTGGLDLARWGATLRYRSGSDGSGQWTLKLAAPETLEGGTARYELDLSGESQTVPARLVDLVTGLSRGRALTAAAELVTVRRTHLLLDADGRTLAELDDDTVSYRSLVDPSRQGTFRELEVELLEDEPGADPTWRDTFQRFLTDAGARTNDGSAKVSRALAPPPTPLQARRKLKRSASLGQLANAILEVGTHQLLTHDVGIRIRHEPEDILQCRLATRRLRAQLQTLGDLLDGRIIEPLLDQLKELATVLGQARDADILAVRMTGQRDLLDPADHGTLDELTQQADHERELARGRLTAYLSGDAYARLIDTLMRLLEEPLCTDPDQKAEELLRARVGDRWSRLGRAVQELSDPPATEDLHAIRKQVERARYASEMTVALNDRRGRTLSKRLAGLQEVLGEVRDAEFTRSWLRRVAADGPSGTALVAGQLIGLETERARLARRAWVSEWKSASDKKSVGWLS